MTSFISRRWRVPEARLHVEVQPLRGGLESTVLLARVTLDEEQPSIPKRLVIKELAAGLEREADIYDLLWRHLERPPAVRVLGREIAGQATLLYLEEAQPCSTWPWSDPALAAAVCRALARLHDNPLPLHGFSWDYDALLARSAEATLALAAGARDAAGRRFWRRLGDLRRVVAALPAIRLRLLAGAPSVIHGDMHPGNVILRDADPRVVLIDWARARVGSPLEDIASWLHSLGCWEPQARRRHDTLMRAYLDTRTTACRFGADVRLQYWLASVSNGLSGAIRYHLGVLADPMSDASACTDSRRALAAWERVVRRGAALLSTSLDRCT